MPKRFGPSDIDKIMQWPETALCGHQRLSRLKSVLSSKYSPLQFAGNVS